MTIEEAIKNIENEISCRNRPCLETSCVVCPYFVTYETVSETMQTLVDWCKEKIEEETE